MASDISLEVNGKKFSGWETGSVVLDIEAVSGSFELGVSERWANQSLAWPINEGDECKVKINGQTVMTGFVDKRNPSYGPDAAGLTVSGRDSAANLIDCSADIGWQFFNTSAQKIIEALCKPFGIHVAVQPELIGKVPIIKQMGISVGEKSYGVLEQACRLAGILAINDGDGEITLTHAGSDRAVTALIEGQNVKEASGNFDISNRFYKYRVLGPSGWFDGTGASAMHVVAEATDPNVKDQTRVLIVQAEGAITKAQAQSRADWEMAVRAGRSDSVTMTVQGWTQADGSLWAVNTLVPVTSPRLRIKSGADMLIKQLRFGLSRATGTTTTLQLCGPDAYKPAPVFPPDTRWKELS